mmetsp:Transcript_12008/g.31810  ORF Transcript_12008/g.31810 Transcript_12008/m.31810 type:complete len:88 (+) Transcript_12008:585-848(+)
MERRRGSAWVVGVVFLNRRNLWLVQAFCEKGAKCGKAHNWECPEIVEKGSCSKGTSCLFRHKPPQAAPIKRKRQDSEGFMSFGEPSD